MRIVSSERTETMASRWRRRRICMLIGPRSAPAAIRAISARGAFLETDVRPPLGSPVELRHPEAGHVAGEVCAIAADGIAIAFCVDARSVAFALAAVGADMSRPVQSVTHSARL